VTTTRSAALLGWCCGAEAGAAPCFPAQYCGHPAREQHQDRSCARTSGMHVTCLTQAFVLSTQLSAYLPATSTLSLLSRAKWTSTSSSAGIPIRAPYVVPCHPRSYVLPIMQLHGPRAGRKVLRQPRLGNRRLDTPRVRICLALAWLYTLSYFSPGDAIPSFALMDIQGPVITTYVYQLIDNEVRVEKVEFRSVALSSPPGYAFLPLLHNHALYSSILPYPLTPHFSTAYTFPLVALSSRVPVLSHASRHSY
jgi:hypothetical protein